MGKPRETPDGASPTEQSATDTGDPPASEVQTDRDRLLSRERAARLEAEDANRLKDEFLATLGHELRTPLNAILGWAHMLQNSELAPAESARAVDVIVRNAQHQASLIEDMLDMSRIISGKLHLDRERVRTAKILEAALDGIRPAAAAKHIVVVSKIEEEVGDLFGDPARLQQIAWNLLSNSLKFTPPGGRIEVRAARKGPFIVWKFRDTGRGIPSGFLPHLFKRFRQADGGITRAHGGLGLGLAIVRQLVELHGGRVHGASDGEGMGATFTVTLPAAPREPAHAVAESPPADVEERPLIGARLLVVDDDQDTCELLTALLTTCGADVSCATSGEKARELLRACRTDVLVCDVGMPGQDGLNFLRELRASGEEAGGWVPAIALSGYAGKEDVRQALAGFQLHIEKPLDPPRLVEAIARLWRRGGRNQKREK